MAHAELAFHADAAEPFVDYARELVERVTGVRLRPTDEGSADVDVYYGDDVRRPCRLRIPRVPSYTTATVPRLPDASAEGVHTSSDFPYDLFSALRFWLADEGHAEASDDAFDEHDRLRADRSVQETLGLREAPVVNAYLLHFRRWLAARAGVDVTSHLPSGTRCVVVLSHDVDSPIDPGSPQHVVGAALANLRRGRKPVQSAAYAAGAVVNAARSRFRDPRARHELFTEIMDAEQARGLRSTFFVAAVSRFDAHGRRRDVGYDVARAPLPHALRELTRRGFGLGLHIAYGSQGDAERITAERERLEAAAGAPVRGSRHHYWHMTRPFWASLEAHGRAGLHYDSSVGFNAAPGYRLGIALPFRPWNPEREAPIPVLQVPTLAMDSMLVREPSEPHAVVERFAGLLSGLKRAEGVAAIDWHEYTSFPGSRKYAAWGQAYLAVLDLLASDAEVLVRTYDELVEEADLVSARHASAAARR